MSVLVCVYVSEHVKKRECMRMCTYVCEYTHMLGGGRIRGGGGVLFFH